MSEAWLYPGSGVRRKPHSQCRWLNGSPAFRGWIKARRRFSMAPFPCHPASVSTITQSIRRRGPYKDIIDLGNICRGKALMLSGHLHTNSIHAPVRCRQRLMISGSSSKPQPFISIRNPCRGRSWSRVTAARSMPLGFATPASATAITFLYLAPQQLHPYVRRRPMLAIKKKLVLERTTCDDKSLKNSLGA